MINKLILFLIQSIHWIYLVLCGISFFLVIILEPFWISVPICGWIMYLVFSRVLDCPWTRLENYYRRKVGKPEIKTFIRHNIIKRFKK